ncbi:MAG: NAD-dependent epimerase/dehydratase family protein [Candidatus Coproplasma sp.]
MKMIVAITGATGNMGSCLMTALANAPAVADKLKVLCRSKAKAKSLLKTLETLKEKIEIVFGDLSDLNVCKSLVKDCDIVLNLGAVIPPTSDGNPQAAIACNVTGVKNLIAAIEEIKDNQPKLIHISSVAVYGNRTGEHKYGRVGDPLVSGPFELYSSTKILGEYAVLQSSVAKWAVLRQTAIYHYNLFSDNLHDGLMFHTCFDAPLEWVTAKDSGILLLNFLKRYKDGTLPEEFWKKVYNIGGGAACREYGYGTYDAGFKIIGGSFQQFFKPWYNATRNFHGMWYYDSDELEKLFSFRGQSSADYWKEMELKHKIYKMGKIVPAPIIAQFAVKRLLKDDNSPSHWVKEGDEARAIAYFGGKDKFEQLKKLTWADVTLPTLIPDPVPQSYEEKMAAYGYDIEKSDSEITIDDLKTVAEAHGGKCLTPLCFDGDMYKKLDWQTCDGEKFTADTYTVLRAGHWEHALYKDFVWEFDRLAKTDKIFARIWYDSHDKDENYRYYFDKNFVAHVDKLKD